MPGRDADLRQSKLGNQKKAQAKKTEHDILASGRLAEPITPRRGSRASIGSAACRIWPDTRKEKGGRDGARRRVAATGLEKGWRHAPRQSDDGRRGQIIRHDYCGRRRGMQRHWLRSGL